MRLLAHPDVWVYWECDHLRDVSHVRDLSLAGLFIETCRSRLKGELVHVDFLVAEGQIRLEGIVAQAQSGKGLGLKFQSVTAGDVPKLAALIERVRSKPLAEPVPCRLFSFAC